MVEVSLEMQELRIFLTVADELHFGRSAEQLLLSPGRVSQAVSALERKLGASLFDRTSRTVRLTDFGVAVRDDVGSAYAELLDAVRRSQRRAGAVVGTLRLGVYGNALNAGPHLTGIVRGFSRAHPACTVHFVDTGSMAHALVDLRAGDVDLCVVRLPLDEPDIAVGPVLTTQPRVLLVARSHPLAGCAAIDYDDIGDQPVGQLHPSLPAQFRDAFIPPTTATGRTLTRAAGALGSATETNLQVAMGAFVHVAVQGWAQTHPHPDVVEVPIRDLPESATALASLQALTVPRNDAFLRHAAQFLRDATTPRSGRQK